MVRFWHATRAGCALQRWWATCADDSAQSLARTPAEEQSIRDRGDQQGWFFRTGVGGGKIPVAQCRDKTGRGRRARRDFSAAGRTVRMSQKTTLVMDFLPAKTPMQSNEKEVKPNPAGWR
jgi:hypothetical protein